MKLVLCLLASYVLSVAAPEQKPETVLLESLLQEVRELRQVMERSSIAVPRYQAALQKWQMQQVRVDQISERLNHLRSIPAEDVKELESQVYSQLNTQARKDAEARVQAAKNRVAYEQQLARQLQQEQNLLRQFEHDYRKAEAALEPPRR
jgi:hypothetical protein